MKIDSTMLSHLVNQGSNKSIAGVKLPNFNYFPTQSTPKLNDDEIRAKVVEMAKRDAAAGVFKSDDNEFQKLTRIFASSVSPDRKGAITNTLIALESKINSLRMLSSTHTSMGEWIELLLGRALLNENFTVNHIDVYDSNGNVIAAFNEQVGWRNVITKDELARGNELRDLYGATFQAAQNGTQTPQTTGNAEQNANVQNSKPTVDIMGMVIEPPLLDVKT